MLDLCMPCCINNEEIKKSIQKINKEFVIIVDFLKITVEFNIKRNMLTNLYQSNINVKFFLNKKNNKLLKTKLEISEKENLSKELQTALTVMQNEISLLLNQSNIQVEF